MRSTKRPKLLNLKEEKLCTLLFAVISDYTKGAAAHADFARRSYEKAEKILQQQATEKARRGTKS